MPLGGDARLESKNDRKRRFRSSKNDEKANRILRILLFSNYVFLTDFGKMTDFAV